MRLNLVRYWFMKLSSLASHNQLKKESARTSFGWHFFSSLNWFPNHVPLASQVQFVSIYGGKTVTGLVGSSVNFTWSFSGNAKTVTWGLKDPSSPSIPSDKRLVSLSKSGQVSLTVPQSYFGRVSGSRSGDSSSGQAIFTLSNIRKSDATVYGCQIEPERPFGEAIDGVVLFVQGESITQLLCKV